MKYLYYSSVAGLILRLGQKCIMKNGNHLGRLLHFLHSLLVFQPSSEWNFFYLNTKLVKLETSGCRPKVAQVFVPGFLLVEILLIQSLSQNRSGLPI